MRRSTVLFATTIGGREMVPRERWPCPTLALVRHARIGAPIALLSMQRRAGLPLWLGIVSAVAIVEQAIETITIFGHRGFTAPGGPMNLLLERALSPLLSSASES